MRAPSFVRRVNNLGERHEVSTSAVAGGSGQNPTRTAEPAFAVAVAVAVVIAFTSPDHPITRSPDHPITRSPDHPITRSPDDLMTRSPDHPILSFVPERQKICTLVLLCSI